MTLREFCAQIQKSAGPRGHLLGGTPRAFSWALLLSVMSVGLSACASRQSAAWAAARSLLPSAGAGTAVDKLVLRPEFRYLRVTVQGRAVVLMVLGYVDQGADGKPVEVWYSADGEVLRLQNGRLAGLVGTPVEWANVRISSASPLAWPSAAGQALRYERHIDRMPGYQWGQIHALSLYAVPPPSSSMLADLGAEDLLWFEERDERNALPPARYAMAPGAAEPTYGEQCLDTTLCLSWQRWPVTITPSPK